MAKSNYTNAIYKDYEKLNQKYNDKKEEYKLLKYEYLLLQSKYNTKCKQIEQAIKIADENASKKYAPIIEEKDNEIARLRGLLGLDGTNSGIPTSMTPINKKKVIPNSRKKSNSNKGGQEGHKKSKLEKFKDEEINEIEEHELESCNKCGGKLIDTNKIIEKDELDYRIVPVKRRHKYKIYKCECCNKEVHENIPVKLKEENQYGSEVQALAVTLINEGNMAINKVRKVISEMTHDEINLSEGYISKLQKRVSEKLESFEKDIKKEILKQKLIYWDDTVIMVNTKRGCLRFYGTEELAYYKAHEKKDKKGIDEDGILTTLTSNNTVMHDHNKVNYNESYHFSNIECNEHLKRDLQKCYDNTQHEWSKEFKDEILRMYHKRKELIKEDKDHFEKEELEKFDSKFTDIILKGIEENEKDESKYYNQEEKALLTRILEYKNNYFLWMYDFSLPFTNNLSERSLRIVKSKMKTSGQFQNIKNAKYYASIKSYIETCYRNEINPFDALVRLLDDVPLSLNEILNTQKRAS